MGARDRRLVCYSISFRAPAKRVLLFGLAILPGFYVATGIPASADFTARWWAVALGAIIFALAARGMGLPDFNGASLPSESKDALWDRFYTAAPRC
ncbi:hypothetical protein X737_16995 [Mesorhizobium sp. L48C026A00]|nr:hypothetical protein X737_16995 [Mesorhizobium sp. L48C026A00]